MEIQLSESQMAEDKIVQMIHGLDVSILETELIFVAVREYGDHRFDEGVTQGWDDCVQESMREQRAMG
jgi:hypothetical protein